MSNQMIFVFDTILRDGTQREGVSFTAEDKLKIVCKLDALGVHYIECGNPGSNNNEYYNNKFKGEHVSSLFLLL